MCRYAISSKLFVLNFSVAVSFLIGCTSVQSEMPNVGKLNHLNVEKLESGMFSVQGWYDHGYEFKIFKNRRDLGRYDSTYKAKKCLSGRLEFELHNRQNEIEALHGKYVKITGYIVEPFYSYDEAANSISKNGNDVCETGALLQAVDIALVGQN